MAPPSIGYPGTQDDVLLARIGAAVVDLLTSSALGAALGFGVAIQLDSSIGVYLGLPLGLLGYYIVLEGVTGQTLGKRLTGVAVISETGDPITFRQSLVRNLFRFVDGVFSYGLGLVVLLLSKDFQRVGDHAANTLVVRAKR